MSRALQTLKPVEGIAQTLAAGQTPACWQNMIKKNTARLKAIERACAWIKPMTSTRLELNPAPLFGRCLEILTKPDAPSTSSQAEETGLRRKKPVWPKAPHWHDRPRERIDGQAPIRSCDDPARVSEMRNRSFQALKEPASQPLPSQVSHLDLQAGKALLCRLAGETVVSESTSQRRHQSPPKADERKARAAPSFAKDPNAHQTWWHKLAEKTEQSLRQNGFDTLHAPRHAAIDLREIDKSLRLEEQSKTPLNGRSVSAELLARLDALILSGGDGSEFEPKRVVAPKREPNTHSHVMPSAAMTKRSQNSEAGPSGRFKTASVEHAAEEAPGSVNYTTKIEEDLESPDRMNSLVVAASRPSLLASQPAGMPPFPLATHLGQEVWRRESGTAEEDLSMLATKIKRILDEEARRHGIEVG